MTTPDPKSDPQQGPGFPRDDAGFVAPNSEITEFDAEHRALLDERDQLRTTVRDIEHTRTRAAYFGVIIGALILILLLVFIVQNMDSQEITLIFWTVNLPVGVSLLIAAVAGALIVALAGGLRMLQMRRALRKARR